MTSSGTVTGKSLTVSHPADDLALGAPIGAGRPTGVHIEANRPPSLDLRTSPPADYSTLPYPTISGWAPFTVRFNLCNSDDPDMYNPDGTPNPNGDSLNWQFNFGDTDRPAFNPDGTFNPDFDHFCRVEHTYAAGRYTATLSVTDKHLEDQSHGVAGLARKTQFVTIDSGPACASVSTSISTSLGPSSPTQTDRLFRNGTQSGCGGKAFPGTFPSGTVNYQTFGFRNRGSASACYRVDYNAGACGTSAHASAYLGGYDPTNKAAGYLGDVGSSVSQSFSFEVPGQSDFVVLVNGNFGIESCSVSFALVNTTCP